MSAKEPVKITITDLQDKVKSVYYLRMPESTLTLCVITLTNGFNVVGHSACVDPTNFNQALGEQYAYNDALEQVWLLEGYVARQRLYEESLQ